MTSILNQYKPQPIGQQRQYAVLIPLLENDGDWQILYQVRSEHISQPGEVAFPGGRVEEGENLSGAAIRETCEELNISPNQIELLGEIDYLVHQTRTVHCFVAKLHIDDWRGLTPNEEVAELFTVPLSRLMAEQPTYYTLKSQVPAQQDFPFDRIRKGRRYDFTDHKRQIPFYEGYDQTIWGMTAMFTHRFTQILEDGQLLKNR